MANTINGDDGVISGSAGLKSSADATGILALQTNGTTRFQIGAAGQLGIGGATYGTSGQVLTSGGASAAPTWTTVSGGGSPGGSTTQVQYNNAGAFGGITGATSDGTALTLTGAILNGTIGATTPSTGAFTTVTTSNAVAVTYDGKVGTAISARYSTSYPKIAVLVGNNTGFSRLAMNANSKAGSDTATYDISNSATRLDMNGGKFVFETAPSGTAGNDITFTQSLEVGKDTTLALQGATSNSGTGITFPATQSASSNANTLDDYEEGTFTTTISGSTSGSGTVVSSASYTKIGNIVTVAVNISDKTFPTYSGDLRVSLPFTAANNGTNPRGGDCYFYPQANWDSVANFVGFYPQAIANQAYVNFPRIVLDSDRQTSLSSSNTTTSNTGGLYLQFTLVYFAL